MANDKPKRTKAKAKVPVIDMAALTALVKGEIGDENAQPLGGAGISIAISGVVSTGCSTIDGAIGRGGVPRGRLTILHGPEAGGKTTLALQIIAEAQRQGGVAIFNDMEYKLDAEYAQALGVDLERVLLTYPPDLESCFKTSAVVANHYTGIYGLGGPPIVVVWDSTNSALTRKMMEADWDDEKAGAYGAQAKVFSRELPKLMRIVHKTGVAMIFISQLRKKQGIMFGDDAEIAGGHSLKHHASLILSITRIGTQKDSEGTPEANKTKIYVRKNSIAPPFKNAEALLVYGKGFDAEEALLRHGLFLKILEKEGNAISLGKFKLGSGIKKASRLLRDSPPTRDKLSEAIRMKMKW